MNQQTLIIIIVGVAVLAIVLIVVAVSMVRRRGSSVERRLNRVVAVGGEGGETAVINTSENAKQVAERIDKALQGKGFVTNIQRLLARADLRLTVAEFLGLKLLSGVGGFGLGVFFGRETGPYSLLFGVLGAILGINVPDIVVGRRAKKRIRSFNNQLGDTITLMANALRSGNSFLQSMEMVANEAAPPINEEFARVIREVGLGISTREALANMLRRVPSDDLDLLVTAINIQQEVGGNLAQILDTLGHTIRERVRIQGEIRVLTAQQMYAGYIISGLPIALGGVIYLIAPSYITRMFVWPYLCMPICGVILIIAGFLAIQKIVKIDV
jgi:tight adherence protein B